MDFNFGNSRERVVQPVLMYNRIVTPGEEAIQVSEEIDQHHLVTGFLINNYSDAPDSVFLGVNKDMHASIEIMPGAAPMFTVLQEGRQFYELQILVMKISNQTAQDLIKIPVMCWDLTHWYLAAAGTVPIEVSVTAFPLPYL